MKVEELKGKIDVLWKATRKDLKKAMKETNTLLKKGEQYVKEAGEKGKVRLEALGFALMREKLYYELGRTLSTLPKNKWQTSKRAGKLINDIKKISRTIKNKKK